MSAVSILLLVVAAPPVVDVTLLSGEKLSGDIRQLDATTLTLVVPKGERNLPASELLELRLARESPVAGQGQLLQVELVDGTRLGAAKLTAAEDRIRIESPELGAVALPQSTVANIRLAAFDAALEEAWRTLTRHEAKQDLLVVRREKLLDHVSGVVGDIDATMVKFLLADNEITAQRSRVYGVVYRRRPAKSGNPLCRIELASSDLLMASTVTCDTERVRARLLSGPEVSLPLSSLGMLDFSPGRVRFLSAMEPREVSYTPFFDEEFSYRRDRTIDGRPLRLGSTRYARGLWIHSKTRLRYRLSGEYRRFRAVIGIDAEVARNRLGADVKVVIAGDGKPLFEAIVRGRDKPRPIDLDLTGVGDLEILVDFVDERDIGISDWLDLADARVVK